MLTMHTTTVSRFKDLYFDSCKSRWNTYLTIHYISGCQSRGHQVALGGLSKLEGR